MNLTSRHNDTICRGEVGWHRDVPEEELESGECDLGVVTGDELWIGSRYDKQGFRVSPEVHATSVARDIHDTNVFVFSGCGLARVGRLKNTVLGNGRSSQPELYHGGSEFDHRRNKEFKTSGLQGEAEKTCKSKLNE